MADASRSAAPARRGHVEPGADPHAASVARLRELFLLDPSWVYLNHGSFGACPRPVFEEYQRWQLELERQPVEFLDRRHDERVDLARARLAGYVGADVDGLVFVPNATAGVNTVGRSLQLAPGDEVLTTDHEYGACILAWRAITQDRGARLVTVALPDPLLDTADLLQALEEAATPRTRVLFFSHLTSATAVLLPALEICRWARDRDIVTVVDGAHVPGQLPVNLAALEADAYTGNCHKWLCGPKAAGFLWVAPELRPHVQPLVVSWGCEPDAPFVRRHGWTGTSDPAAALSVPAAIDFQDQHQWANVQQRGLALAAQFQDAVVARYGTTPLQSGGPRWHRQMVSVPLPILPKEAVRLQQQLRDDRRIEVPVRPWNGRTLIRASFQGYNGEDDLEALLTALAELM